MKKLYLIMILIYSIGLTLLADDGSVFIYPSSGNVVPLKNNSIIMSYEKVVYKDEKITAHFIFENTTTDIQKVILGFPVYYNIDTSKIDTIYQDLYCYLYANREEKITPEEIKLKKQKILKEVENYFNFKSIINGKEIQRKIYETNEKEYGYNYVFTTEITFNPNEKIEIVDTYNQKMDIVDSPGNYVKKLKYVITSGSSWKNGIDKGEFEFYFKKKKKEEDENDLFSYIEYIPDDFEGFPGLIKRSLKANIPFSQIDENDNYIIAKYNFENFKPKKDIEIEISSDGSDYDKLFENVKNINSNKFYKENREFFDEMQDIKNYKSLIYAISKLRVSPDEDYNEPYNVKTNLRFLINSIYAIHGHKFQTEFWKTFFQKFKWYNPAKEEKTIGEINKILNDLIMLEKKREVEF